MILIRRQGKCIYQMALDGYGLSETTAALARDGILNPMFYKKALIKKVLKYSIHAISSRYE